MSTHNIYFLWRNIKTFQIKKKDLSRAMQLSQNAGILTHSRLNELPHTTYWKIILDFRYVRLSDLDIPKDKWLNYK